MCQFDRISLYKLQAHTGSIAEKIFLYNLQVLFRVHRLLHYPLYSIKTTLYVTHQILNQCKTYFNDAFKLIIRLLKITYIVLTDISISFAI